MSKPLMRVAVTGGAGQIAYSLLFRIANGEMFGPDQPVALHILEIPPAMEALRGTVMELEDCAFPLLEEINWGSDAMEVFKGIHWALLVGAKPRGPGMERGDLLSDNGKIFIAQGRALNEVADPDCRTVVVGNPCNTNCLIAMTHAPKIPRQNFHAMTRLDENRAASQLATKAGILVKGVSNVTIWGNHSATQVPDFVNARISGKPASHLISDRDWLEADFVQSVQSRGAAIIKARGKSSAASAANAVVDHVKSLMTPTPEGEWFSTAVCTDGNPYGLPEDLIFSMPCRSNGDGTYEVVGGVPWDEYLKSRIQVTLEELQSEKELVSEILNGIAS